MPDNSINTVPVSDNMAEAQKITHKIDDANSYAEDAEEKGSDSTEQPGERRDTSLGQA